MNYSLSFLFAVLLLSSCSTPTTLFSDSTSQPIPFSVVNEIKDPVLKPGDKITISIWGHESLSIGSVNSVYNSNEETGKWVVVDDDGRVNLPKIGRVTIAGYTSKEANFFLEQQYIKHLKDPIINIKVLNHYVTVLGEVNKPGKYKIDNEQISLIEVLGEAEGLTDYAQAEGIRVIREENAKTINYKVDLSNADYLYKQNLALQPNDVVYVIPKKGKETGKKAAKAAPFVGIITGIAVLISVFIK